MSGSRKILIFATSYLPYIGGAETAIKGITDQITDYEFDLITARRDKTLPGREKIGNVDIYRVGSRLALMDLVMHKSFFPLSAYRKGKELLAMKKYDLVFVLQASQAGGAVWLLKKRGLIKQPIVLNLQEGRDFKKFAPLKSYFFRKILSVADVVVAISEYLRQIAVQNGVDEGKIQILPNGVDMENFGREFSSGEISELRNQLGIKSDEQVIISASRLTEKNGLDDLIKAMAVLVHHRKFDKFKLVLAGNGEDRKKLTDLADGLSVAGKVVFAGTIDNDVLPKYLRMADIFVRPSRSEGLGSAFLEAMAAGLPVIGTPVGGIPDFLRDGETGLFCKVDDPQSIADKIEAIADDATLRSTLVREGYLMVSKNYNWKRIASGYKLIFDLLTK